MCFCSRFLNWLLMPVLLPNSARAPRHARIACAEGIFDVFSPALRSTSLGQRRNPVNAMPALDSGRRTQVGRRILGHGGTGSGLSKVSFAGVCSGHLLAVRNRSFPCTHSPPMSRGYSPPLGNDLSRFAFFSWGLFLDDSRSYLGRRECHGTYPYIVREHSMDARCR